MPATYQDAIVQEIKNDEENVINIVLKIAGLVVKKEEAEEFVEWWLHDGQRRRAVSKQIKLSSVKLVHKLF